MLFCTSFRSGYCIYFLKLSYTEDKEDCSLSFNTTAGFLHDNETLLQFLWFNIHLIWNLGCVKVSQYPEDSPEGQLHLFLYLAPGFRRQVCGISSEIPGELSERFSSNVEELGPCRAMGVFCGHILLWQGDLWGSVVLTENIRVLCMPRRKWKGWAALGRPGSRILQVRTQACC